MECSYFMTCSQKTRAAGCVNYKVKTGKAHVVHHLRGFVLFHRRFSNVRRDVFLNGVSRSSSSTRTLREVAFATWMSSVHVCSITGAHVRSTHNSVGWKSRGGWGKLHDCSNCIVHKRWKIIFKEIRQNNRMLVGYKRKKRFISIFLYLYISFYISFYVYIYLSIFLFICHLSVSRSHISIALSLPISKILSFIYFFAGVEPTCQPVRVSVSVVQWLHEGLSPQRGSSCSLAVSGMKTIPLRVFFFFIAIFWFCAILGVAGNASWGGEASFRLGKIGGRTKSR